MGMGKADRKVDAASTHLDKVAVVLPDQPQYNQSRRTDNASNAANGQNILFKARSRLGVAIHLKWQPW